MISVGGNIMVESNSL